MSSFNCPKCGSPCIDTPRGYIRGCAHHPADAKPTPQELSRFSRRQYGQKSMEHGFCCRFLLLVAGLGPDLTDEELTLLLLLIEAWRDEMFDNPPKKWWRP